MSLAKAMSLAKKPAVNAASDSFILVVDDEPANLSLLKETLSCAGFKVRVVTSGLKALEITQKYLPALILLDVAMPDMDGFETCQALKSNPKTEHIPVIFATASTETSQKIKGFTLGAVDYITKPFQVEEVVARVKVQFQLQQLATALRHKNQQLEQSLKELRHTQVKLIQSEKMSSLGRLVAGVAHEINNPISFIYCNLPPAQDYCQDLIDLVNRYRQEYTSPSQELQRYINEIDLDFLEQDLPQLFKSFTVGAERIHQIVLSLRNFSRLDEAEMKAVNIHEGIDSTLMVLHHRLQGETHPPAIDIEKQYGALPLVECYPSQLNQALMNILINAIEALENRNCPPNSSDSLGPGKIQITTAVSHLSYVSICISDNGDGIAEDIGSKLFEPFFTTKPVGEGTGLGLSISYEIIVNKHSGYLTCSSTPGQGTCFTIELPISHNLT